MQVKSNLHTPRNLSALFILNGNILTNIVSFRPSPTWRGALLKLKAPGCEAVKGAQDQGRES